MHSPRQTCGQVSGLQAGQLRHNINFTRTKFAYFSVLSKEITRIFFYLLTIHESFNQTHAANSTNAHLIYQ